MIGHEDLPANAFTRPFVERVGDDTDDCDVELRVGPRPEADSLPDGALGAEEVLGELAVHNRDLRPGEFRDVPRHAVAHREITPLQDRDLHRREVTGGHGVHEGLHVFAVCGLVAFDRHAAVPLVAAQDRHVRVADRLDAW